MADAEQSARTTAPLYALLPPALKQVLLLVGLAAAIAAGVAVVFWSQGSNYTPLYSGLADRDIGEITTQLDAQNVPYKLDPANGGVLVPSDKKYEVRMQLAGSGLPRGTGFGIDEMPSRSTFGQTPFMENALYVRAVETELGRTIGAMQPVESARVHLALPPQSVFVRQKREPSASVMLKMYSGRRLDATQVQAVVHLVASSVPDLTPSRVTVVDQSGALLTSATTGDSTASLSGSQFDYRKQVETEYSQRIENLLASVVGSERVRASVSADIDFTVTEQTRESYDPAVQVVRSEQTSEDTHRGDGVQGVPGALSNQPPAVATPPANAAAGANASAPTNQSRSATRNYELDKTVSHTTQAVGAVKRLSIGVLVDNKPAANGRGAGTPLTDAEIASLTGLVKQSVGFDEMRGDTISMINSAFQPAAAVQTPTPPSFWERPQFWSIARLGLAAVLVLLLALFVLKPMMAVLTRPQQIAQAPAALEYAQQMYPAMAGGGRPMGLPVGYDDRMAAARSVAGQDPRQVAQVVKNWVAEDNG